MDRIGPNSSPPEVHAMRPRVLFIEDNLTQLDLWTLMLERDFNVLAATRGEEGAALAIQQRPDAVVVDALLPDVNGLEVCARLQADGRTRSIPLVVLTGDDPSFAHAEQLRTLDAVLRKPCPADVLIAVVRRAIAIRKIL
jgi:CheY-like chemotaxis protein